jgi:aspartyl-tRNA(Asn)/glutamyl-tRNA(Gln) amidotransferase subunit A
VELIFEPMHVVAGQVAARELSPVEVAEAALGQIERHGERLNPFITVTAELARQMARDAEREITSGNYRGALHGIPVVLKDLLATRGIRTTGGSQVLRDWAPDDDATVVRLLRDAGAVFLGKTGMPEFAVCPTSTNPFYGAVHNPWNEQYDTAGSSSGTAAAIAAGMAWAGPGSDTGGSIRMPATACGIVGLKPTWGRVSLRGVLPLCIMHDHIGPMARTVRDTALLMQALAWYDPHDPFCRDVPVDDYVAPLEDGVAGLRLGVLADDGGPAVEPQIQAAFERAVTTLEQLGAELVEVRLPGSYELVRGPVVVLEDVQTAADYQHYFPDRAAELSPQFRAFAESGLRRTGIEHELARRETNNALHQFERALGDVDLLLTPGTSVFPPPAGEERLELLRFTNLWDVNGWPAISVPVGLSSDNLPIGLQIVGKPWQEALVLRAARTVEREHAPAYPPPGLA